jgi:hypothetical protein
MRKRKRQHRDRSIRRFKKGDAEKVGKRVKKAIEYALNILITYMVRNLRGELFFTSRFTDPGTSRDYLYVPISGTYLSE